tara:strand:+ start:2478 stop:3176 length:699 start_codon:yes stop_codon:yes gene_type:complete
MNTTLITLLIAGTAAIASADTLYLQDFENGATGYSTSTPEFTDGGTDFFGRSDNISFSGSVVYNGADGEYFAGMDLDGEGAGLPLHLTTNAIDISNTNNLQFAIDLAEDDDGSNQDWDDSDYVRFEYNVDGNGWVEIFTALNTNNIEFNTEPQINGTAITSTFSTFSADLSGLTGLSMQLRLVWQLDSGDEDLAVDNIMLSGDRIAVVPLPSAAFAGLGLLGAMGAYRRIRA